MISVIIPVYNAEHYLRQCLNSVCNQTFQDIEIIAINDGSTDASEQILAEYAAGDSRMHVITQSNRGISQTRNVGISCARGEWIAFVDSDDWLAPEALEQAIRAAIEDDADIIMWSYVREYPTGSKPLQIFGSERKRYTANPLLYPYRRMVGPIKEELAEPQKLNSGVTVWGKIYRRTVIGSHRMEDIEWIGSEDTFFNIEVFSNARVVTYLPEQYYHYRKENAQSFTKQNHEKMLSQFSVLYEQIGQHIGQDPILKEALQNRICLGLIGLGMRYVRHRSDGLRQKCRALSSFLKRSEYREALAKLQTRYLPFHWRWFFFCARKRLTICLYIMLRVMDWMRRSI